MTSIRGSRVDPEALSAHARELFERTMAMSERAERDRLDRKRQRVDAAATEHVDHQVEVEEPKPWESDVDGDPWANRKDLD